MDLAHSTCLLPGTSGLFPLAHVLPLGETLLSHAPPFDSHAFHVIPASPAAYHCPQLPFSPSHGNHRPHWGSWHFYPAESPL